MVERFGPPAGRFRVHPLQLFHQPNLPLLPRPEPFA